MAVLLDGKKLKAKKLDEFKARVDKLISRGINPHLVVVQIGNNEASNVYIGHKQKMCEQLGIKSTKEWLPEDVSLEEFKKKIDALNKDENVHGILVQFPLPPHIKNEEATMLIDPKKDVDGIHPLNQGINFTRTPEYAPIPCTANGIMEFFKEYNIPLEGKDVAIIGRSNIVGRPSSYLFANANASVMMLHSRTNEETFKRVVKSADIIVLATGMQDLITPEMVKQDSIIIDVGIIRMDNGKLRGDILYRDFMDKCSYITPVPGGVGPMTVTMLMENLISLAEQK